MTKRNLDCVDDDVKKEVARCIGHAIERRLDSKVLKAFAKADSECDMLLNPSEHFRLYWNELHKKE